ncbi:phosphocarrier protein [Paenibacillus sp. UNCCL117]|uniref:HPr family phosphocarrier protein n=1 Tax=unclassified Paenibacillus TaxID=185978 RepID=UPI000889CAE9|nr:MULTISPECIES: HPr family phosphocarrier protein [unclassified Paenibacillus]SDC04949.1 phosphocarrier protein [Paenibacillus sp. cl123]SFW37456.1 phosphocarrier protein [Paenibacillus sp. UNCCL117]
MQKEYVIENVLGLHVRPAKKIVQTASKYAADVFLEKDGKRVSAKSLVNVLTLGVKHGEKVKLITEGDQAEAAQQEIGEILSEAIEAAAAKKES